MKMLSSLPTLEHEFIHNGNGIVLDLSKHKYLLLSVYVSSSVNNTRGGLHSPFGAIVIERKESMSVTNGLIKFDSSESRLT
jgi:hypothetical protein